MREAVNWFSQEMNKSLEKHSHRDTLDGDGWLVSDLRFLLQRLHEETEELCEALGAIYSPKGHLNEVAQNENITSANAIGEAIDVGNMAMMIADFLRQNHKSFK